MGAGKFMRRLSTDKKAVILLSGGIDSVTTLYFAKKYGYSLHALIFDYRQRHRKEIYSAIKIAKLNKVYFSLIDVHLPWAHSALTQKDIGVSTNRNSSRKEIPVTYVAGRNIILLSFAVSFAESLGAKKIFIGAHIQDYSGYPDCRPEFLQAFERAINLGIYRKGIEIVAPLISKTKREIVELGKSLGVPFEHTWSCYMGGAYPCGRCDSCRFRLQAFKSLKLEDPLLKPKRK